MSAVTASLCSTLLFVGVFVFVSAEQKNITAESGQNVTLTCRAPNNNITVLEWSRADLGHKNVFVYRNGGFLPDVHPSFMNRVHLQMKDGDVSVILKNVTVNDTGTYKCCIVVGKTDSCDPISSIYLHVDPRDQRNVLFTLGRDATLECYGPKDASIIMLKWKKPDLEVHHYAIYFRQDHFHDDYQHEFFKGRVTMKDPEWRKTGNLSMILKNVTMNDTGTYECHAGYDNDGVKLLSTVNLTVVPPAEPRGPTESGISRGHPGLVASWSFLVLCLFLLAVLLVF